MRRLSALFVFAPLLALATTPEPLQVTRIYAITSSGQVIDNRPVSAQNNYFGFFAMGSGTWSVTLQYSDVSSSGPWAVFGQLSTVTNSSLTSIGYGTGYHPWVSFALNGSVTVNYSASKDFFIGLPSTIGLPDPGANGIVMRTAPNTTRVAVAADIVTLLGGNTFDVFGAAANQTLASVTIDPSFTVGPNAILANTLIQFDSSNNVIPATGVYSGIANSSAQPGGIVRVAGTANEPRSCVFDGSAVVGHIAIPSVVGDQTHCMDSGVSSTALIPNTTPVIGVIRSPGGAGTVGVDLFGTGTFGTLQSFAGLAGNPLDNTAVAALEAGDANLNGPGTQTFTVPVTGPSFTPTSFGFSTGIQNLYVMPKTGTGATVPDLVGGKTAIVTPGGAVSWNSDGSLHFDGNTANRWQAPTVNSFLTLEVAFIMQNAGTNDTFYDIAGYDGAPSGSFLQPVMQLNVAWWGGGDGMHIPSYLGYHLCCSANNTYSSAVAPIGIHIAALTLTPNGAIHEYLDGEEVQDYWSPATFAQAALSNGYLSFGGDLLGVQNCTSCGFKGSIYGVATYSNTQTSQQMRADYNNWLSILKQYGLTPNSTRVFANNNGGAQSAANKPVQILCYGPSECWGRGLSSPTTQNWIAQAALTINGGNAFGFAYGYDVDNEYITHKTRENIISQTSPIARNIVVLHNSDNDCKTSQANSGYPTYTLNVSASVVRDMLDDTYYLQQRGWMVIWSTGWSSSVIFNGGAQVGNTAKDDCNPAIRQAALQNGIPLWDYAANPIIGADNAFSGGATNCSGGPIYQSDQVHPTACLDALAGSNLAVLVNKLLYSAPTTVTGTYNMTGPENPVLADPSGGNATIRLPHCFGMVGQSYKIINTQSVGANTVTINPWSTFTTETIDDASTYVIPNNASITLTSYSKGDVTAGCGWTIR